MKQKCQGSSFGCRIAVVIAALLFCVWPARAGDAVQPASVTINSYRTEGVSTLSAQEYYIGDTLRFTNCVAWASGTDTNGVRQGLSNVTVQVTLGTQTTGTTYTESVSDASKWLWSCDTTVPDLTGQVYMQLRLTDENTNSFTYPWKTVQRKARL